MRRLPQLDGIRGIAILLVLIWHYSEFLVTEQGTWLDFIKQSVCFSWSGVDLFFVLSGFLIGGILIDNRDASNYFTVFYLRRSTRILPLYIAFISVFFLFLVVSAHDFSWLTNENLPWWSYLTFTQNFLMAWQSHFGANWSGITWSLAVEEQFYLLLPLVVRYVPRRTLVYVLIALILAAVLIRAELFHYFSKDHILSVYVLMPCRADALLLGVLCAWFARSSSVDQLVVKNKVMMHATLAILIFGATALAFRFHSYAAREVILFGFTWLALLYACIILIAVTEAGAFMVWITSIKFLRWLGEIAFGVYLVHLPIAGILFGMILKSEPRISSLKEMIIAILSIFVALFLAHFSRSKFERRFIELGHRAAFIIKPPVLDSSIPFQPIPDNS